MLYHVLAFFHLIACHAILVAGFSLPWQGPWPLHGRLALFMVAWFGGIFLLKRLAKKHYPRARMNPLEASLYCGFSSLTAYPWTLYILWPPGLIAFVGWLLALPFYGAYDWRGIARKRKRSKEEKKRRLTNTNPDGTPRLSTDEIKDKIRQAAGLTRVIVEELEVPATQAAGTARRFSISIGPEAINLDQPAAGLEQSFAILDTVLDALVAEPDLKNSRLDLAVFARPGGQAFRALAGSCYLRQPCERPYPLRRVYSHIPAFRELLAQDEVAANL